MNSLPRSLMHSQDSCRTVSFLFLVFIYSFIFFFYFFFVISLGHWSEFLKMWRMRCDDSKGESFLSLGWNGRWEMERRDGAVKVRHLVEIWVGSGWRKWKTCELNIRSRLFVVLWDRFLIVTYIDSDFYFVCYLFDDFFRILLFV